TLFVSMIALLSTHRWRPMSISVQATLRALMKFLGYAALLSAILLYPTEGAASERRFVTGLILMVTTAGLLVAIIGLLSWVFGNGKILWFFVPLDWPGP